MGDFAEILLKNGKIPEKSYLFLNALVFVVELIIMAAVGISS